MGYSTILAEDKKKSVTGKTSNWFCKLLQFDKVNIESLWLRYQAEVLPYSDFVIGLGCIHECCCFEIGACTHKVGTGRDRVMLKEVVLAEG